MAHRGMLQDSYKDKGARFDKVKGPGDTLDWAYQRFSSLDMPILEEIRRIDKGRLGIPVYVSRYAPGVARLTGTAKQMGKGVTPEQAKASAVMELVERYSLFSFVKERSRDYSNIEGVAGNPLDIQELLKALHVGGEATRKDMEVISALPMEWAEAFSPLDEQWFDLPLSWFWPINEYNGSAAGNSLEEASVQAICEVIERHVCSLITYKGLKTPAIDPASVQNPDARDLLERFRETGVKVVLKDFSLELGIPTVGAIAWDPETFPQRSEIVYTAGTAPHPERALIRALTEVAQLAGDFDTEGKYVESGLPKFDTLEEAAYVLDATATVPIQSLPDCSDGNFRVEVEKISRALSRNGLNVFLLDITHPGLKIPAVYAVIPGNHFRDRTIDLDLPFHCARMAALTRDPGAGLQALELIEAAYPERFEVAFYTGHCLEKMGRHTSALRWYDRALGRDPDPGELASILCHKGACLKELGDYPAAIKELERARELNPSLKEVHNLLGYCLYKSSRHVEAIEAFEQAIRIDPASAIDYANIASNLRAMGMGEAALVWYRMALELDPGLKWAEDQMKKIMNNHSTTGG